MEKKCTVKLKARDCSGSGNSVPRGTEEKPLNGHSTRPAAAATAATATAATATAAAATTTTSHSAKDRLWQVKRCPNGGATYVCLEESVFRCQEQASRKQHVDDFFREVFSVDPKTKLPKHTMGIVRGGARSLPDPLLKLAEVKPPVVGCMHGLLDKSAASVPLAKYYEMIKESRCGNCFRTGPLDSLSLVGKCREERGGYFAEILDSLEENAFLNAVMPWGRLSVLDMKDRKESDDGPILWVRPGEQMVASDGPAAKRARRSADASLLYSSRSRDARETLFEDRTYCHADQVKSNDDDGLDRRSTCAVGVLKGVLPSRKPSSSRMVVKDVIAFSAQFFQDVVTHLKLDLFELPVGQCNTWLCQGKLNSVQAAIDGLRYAHIQLQTDDIYFIPRHVIHQFQTTAACTSIAWHLRYAGYADKEHCFKLFPFSEVEPVSVATNRAVSPAPDVSSPAVKKSVASGGKRRRHQKPKVSMPSDDDSPPLSPALKPDVKTATTASSSSPVVKCEVEQLQAITEEAAVETTPSASPTQQPSPEDDLNGKSTNSSQEAAAGAVTSSLDDLVRAPSPISNEQLLEECRPLFVLRVGDMA